MTRFFSLCFWRGGGGTVAKLEKDIGGALGLSSKRGYSFFFLWSRALFRLKPPLGFQESVFVNSFFVYTM